MALISCSNKDCVEAFDGVRLLSCVRWMLDQRVHINLHAIYDEGWALRV